MTIRDATEADFPAIVAIYNASVPGRTATADTEPVSIESRRDWFRDHDPEKRPLWVAVDNEIIVGWLSFSIILRTSGVPCYRRDQRVRYSGVAAKRNRAGTANQGCRAITPNRIEDAPGIHLRPQCSKPAFV